MDIALYSRKVIVIGCYSTAIFVVMAPETTKFCREPERRRAVMYVMTPPVCRGAEWPYCGQLVFVALLLPVKRLYINEELLRICFVVMYIIQGT